MSFDQFGCERRYIESIRRLTQQNILITTYCSNNFGMINFVDIFYRQLHGNAIMIFILTCALFPIAIVLVAYITNKYIALGMKNIANKFDLSAPIAAVVVLSIINGTTDVFNNFNEGALKNGRVISISCALGAFIFSLCVSVSNVFRSSKGEIIVPKFAILKEMITLGLILCMITGFGIMKNSGSVFGILSCGLYLVYLIVSFKIQKWDEQREENGEAEPNDFEDDEEAPPNPFGLGSASKIKTSDAPAEARDSLFEESKISRSSVNRSSVNRSSVNRSSIGNDSVVLIQPPPEPSKLLTELWQELTKKEGLFLEEILGFPIKLFGLLFMPSRTNPLLKTPFKYIVTPLGFMIAIYSIETKQMSLATFGLFGLGMSVLLFLLSLCNFEETQNFLNDLTTIYAALAFTKFFSTVAVDVVYFLVFYFSINEVLMSALLIGFSNSLTDLFNNAALAHYGEEVMAFIGCYSSQVFTLVPTFGLYSLILSMRGDDDFDIFGFDFEPDPSSPEQTSASSYLIIALMFVSFLLIAVKTTYLHVNNYAIRSDFPKIVLAIYLLFCFGCMGIGFLIH